MTRNPQSSMAPRAVNEMSERKTSETSLQNDNTGRGPMLPAIVHRLGSTARRLYTGPRFRFERGDAEVRRETYATRTLRSSASLRTPRLDRHVIE